MRDRILLIAAIAAPLFLAFLALPADAAENGWLRGSCESGSGTYRWSDGNRYEAALCFLTTEIVTKAAFAGMPRMGLALTTSPMAIALRVSFAMASAMVAAPYIAPMASVISAIIRKTEKRAKEVTTS
jgi:hypothetical protein